MSTVEEQWWETRRCPARDDGPHVFGTEPNEESLGLGPNRCLHCDQTTRMLAGQAARAGLPTPTKPQGS